MDNGGCFFPSRLRVGDEVNVKLFVTLYKTLKVTKDNERHTDPLVSQ